jgi:hypothetical protein
MNNTLTLQQFAQMVATSADISMDESQSFIASLTDHIRSLLAAGEKAHLPGIGTFAVIETDGKPSVMFAPDDSFAEAVNEPFAMFEPMELDDDAAIDIAQSEIEVTKSQNDDNEPAQDSASALQESSTPAVADNNADEVEDEDTNRHNETDPVSPQHTDAQPINPPIQSVVTPIATPQIAPSPTRQYRIGWLSMGIAIGAVIGYLVAALIYTSKDISDSDDYDTTYQEAIEYTDTIPSVSDEADANVDIYPTATASSSLCTDTVTTKRYITHMAKDYYGDRNFWVYIYEANREALGHPERTLPGTVVEIPVPSSIPANPSNPDDIRKAKLLAAEIYARFQ